MGCTRNQVSLFLVLYSALEILLFAGTVFGWHALNYVLKKDGYFSNLCSKVENATQPVDANFTASSTVDVKINLTRNTTDDERTPVCGAQDSAFNLVFTLSVCITGGLVFFCGFLFDKFGTRFCRCISLVCAMISFPMVAFSTPDTSVLLFPGLICFSFGTYLILLTNLQMASLIPTKKSTFMCVLTGSFDAASSFFLLLKFSHAAGFTLRNFFLCYFAFFMSAIGTSTFLFHSKYRIKVPIPPDYQPMSIMRYLKRRRERKSKPTSGDGDTSRSGEETIPAISVSKSKDEDCNSERNIDHLEFGAKNKFLSHVRDDRNMLARSWDRLHVLRDTNLEKALSLRSLQDFADIPVERHKSEELVLFTGSHCNVAGNYSIPADTGDNVNVSETTPDVAALKEPTFREILFSAIYLFDLLWISLLRLRSWFFMGAFNPLITYMAKGDDAIVSHYTSVFAIMQFFGFVFAPISGRLMDRKKGKANDDPRLRKIERLEVCVLSFALNSFISVLMSIGATIPILEVQYATCALSVVQRAFLYGPNTAFIAQVFPLKHFGKLFGMYMTVASIFSLIQYPMFVVMKGPLDGDPFVMNMILLVLMVVSFAHPIYLWWFCRSSAQKIRKQMAEEGLKSSGKEA